MDTRDIVRAFVPFLGLFMNIIFQISAFRIFCGKSFLRSILVGFFAGLVILFIGGLILRESVGIIIGNEITYILLSYCYFHFLNLGETARRIRLLRELVESGQGLTQEQILSRYNAQEIFKRRIDRLIESGQVVCLNNKYYIGKPVMLIAAKILFGLRAILFKKGRQGE